MTDPVFPDENCIKTLRSTVATLLAQRPKPQQLVDIIISRLREIQEASASGDHLTVAANCGTIASAALVLMLNAMAMLPPKGKA